jgi:hypothetical protein
VPRDLADVLHYFMPEIAADENQRTEAVHIPAIPPEPEFETASLPLAAVPIADHEIVVASLVAGLASEISALGGDSTILTPATPNAQTLFAQSQDVSPSIRVETCDAQDLASLHRAAIELAGARARDHPEGGVVLVRIPPLWLRGAEQHPELLEWTLLFTSPQQRSLEQTYALAALVLEENPQASVGITVRGAIGQRDGEEAFARLAHSVEQRLGLTLTSYGLLVEDLDICRAIVAERPIGQAHPNSLAARALRETAKLVYERAKKSMLS